MEISMNVIAKVHSDFPSKFGIPRQSGIVEALKGVVVFEPCYRRFEIRTCCGGWRGFLIFG